MALRIMFCSLLAFGIWLIGVSIFELSHVVDERVEKCAQIGGILVHFDDHNKCLRKDVILEEK